MPDAASTGQFLTPYLRRCKVRGLDPQCSLCAKKKWSVNRSKTSITLLTRPMSSIWLSKVPTQIIATPSSRRSLKSPSVKSVVAWTTLRMPHTISVSSSLTRWASEWRVWPRQWTRWMLLHKLAQRSRKLFMSSGWVSMLNRGSSPSMQSR